MSATAKDPIVKNLEKARGQIAKGDLKNAALTLNQINAQSKDDPRVFMLGALLSEKAGNVKAAFESLRKAVSLAPNWAWGQLELALLLARQNQFQEATEVAEKVALLEPKNLQVLAGVVDIAHRAQNHAMAVNHLRRGLKLVPGEATLRLLLARDLIALGQHDESLEVWNGLVEQNPSDELSLAGRAQALIAAGKPADAERDLLALLKFAPDNSAYPYYLQIARGETPVKQPPAVIRSLFDGMAELYDVHMVRNLKYQLPKLTAEKIVARFPDKKANLLDLGCGSGLLGVCLGPLDGALVGVDLSMKMLEQAVRHNVYNKFHSVDLHDALRETPDGLYQVITALDVFDYAGDLAGAIPNAFRVLANDGVLIFSCATTAGKKGPDVALLPAGRYVHKRSHVEAICKAAGFDSVDVEEIVLYVEKNQPVQGVLVTAHKPA